MLSCSEVFRPSRLDSLREVKRRKGVAGGWMGMRCCTTRIVRMQRFLFKAPQEPSATRIRGTIQGTFATERRARRTEWLRPASGPKPNQFAKTGIHCEASFGRGRPADGPNPCSGFVLRDFGCEAATGAVTGDQRTGRVSETISKFCNTC